MKTDTLPLSLVASRQTRGLPITEHRAKPPGRLSYSQADALRFAYSPDNAGRVNSYAKGGAFALTLARLEARGLLFVNRPCRQFLSVPLPSLTDKNRALVAQLLTP